MCLICRDLDNLTFIEAVNNYREIKNEIKDQHLAELVTSLLTKGSYEIKNNGIPSSKEHRGASCFIIREACDILNKD